MKSQASTVNGRHPGTFVLRAVALVSWLIMMMWLVRYEAFPEFFTRSLEGYRSLLSSDVLVVNSWMRILVNGKPIGYSHTTMEVDESNPMHYHVMNNRVQAKLKMMGEMQSLRADTTVMLNLMNQLQTFSFNMSTPGQTVSIRAERCNERQFEVLLKTGAVREKQVVDIPPDVVLYSPMTEMAMKNLKPGQELSIRTLDPVTMTSARMVIKALRRETVQAAGRDYEATALAVEYQNVTFRSWIGADGQMVRQETPMGWTLERCTIDEAFAALESSRGAEDMLSGMAVKVKGRIANPRGCRQVRLWLRGVPFAREELETNRQIVEELGEDDARLLVKAGWLPSVKKRQAAAWLEGGPAPDGFKPYLAASTHLQSDHPDLRAQAKKIVGDQRDPLEKAKLIYDWVYKNVDKKLTISLPSALDVLRTMRGDCNEHTYLFVALARAAGLPASIKVGVAYHQDAFYYHAWPAVYVGEWMEMDPTWGQLTVDATHLALVEGELASQVKLVKVMGQLRIEVVAEGQRSVPEPEARDTE